MSVTIYKMLPFIRNNSKFNLFPKDSMAVKQFKQAQSLLHRLLGLTLVKGVLAIALIALITPLILFFILRPKMAKDIVYGITFSDKYATDLGLDWKDTYIKILDDLNVKHLRLVAYWDEIEPQEGQFNFDIIKWQIEEAQKRDTKIILLVGRKAVRYPECYEPSWAKSIENKVVRDAKLYNYVRRTITELQGYEAITMWQIENEPFFPFGECPKTSEETLKYEVGIAKTLDNRPILVQDSGEGGLWKKTYDLGNYLGISMYRKIWYDFWGVFFGNFIYFKYPLAHWSYKIKADILGVPYDKVIVTELQAEPWGPSINSLLSQKEKDKSFSESDFLETISYAQKTGFKEFYLWGAEWWLWEKQVNNNPFFWNTGKAIFN